MTSTRRGRHCRLAAVICALWASGAVTATAERASGQHGRVVGPLPVDATAPVSTPPATGSQSPGSVPHSGAASRSLTIEEALGMALESSPELQSATREIEAARARQQGASMLLRSNPEVTTSAGPRSMDGGDSVDWSVSLAQRVEIGGQRAARMEAADAGLRVAESRLVARRSALVADVREAFGRVLAAEELSRVAAEALTLARDGLAAATERHEAGGASLIEVNSARIELGRATREAAMAGQDGHAALAALRLLLGADADFSTVRPDGLAESKLCDEAPDVLLAAARGQRGDLAAARAELEQARAEQRLAEREAIASPSIGVAYNREDDADIIQATLSVPLPIVDRNQVERGVAGARFAQARLTLESLERAVAKQVELATAQCAAARAIADSYRGEVVRAAESNLELANEGYLAGKLDFLQLLLIRREALDARRGAAEGLQQSSDADAQMVRVTGGGW